MSKIAKFVALVSAALAFPTAAAAQTVTFAEEPLGALPKEFDHGVMGVGAVGRWEVVRDETAADGKALAQLSTDTREHRFLTAFYKPLIAANEFLPSILLLPEIRPAAWLSGSSVRKAIMSRGPMRWKITSGSIA